MNIHKFTFIIFTFVVLICTSFTTSALAASGNNGASVYKNGDGWVELNSLNGCELYTARFQTTYRSIINPQNTLGSWHDLGTLQIWDTCNNTLLLTGEWNTNSHEGWKFNEVSQTWDLHNAHYGSRDRGASPWAGQYNAWSNMTIANGDIRHFEACFVSDTTGEVCWGI